MKSKTRPNTQAGELTSVIFNEKAYEIYMTPEGYAQHLVQGNGQFGREAIPPKGIVDQFHLEGAHAHAAKLGQDKGQWALQDETYESASEEEVGGPHPATVMKVPSRLREVLSKATVGRKKADGTPHPLTAYRHRTLWANAAAVYKVLDPIPEDYEPFPPPSVAPPEPEPAGADDDCKDC